MRSTIEPTAVQRAAANLKETVAGSSGPWSAQQAGRSTEVFLGAFLTSVLESVTEIGSFNMKQLDHRAGFAYAGVSNKELVIHASKLAGRPVRSYPVAKLIVMSALLNGASYTGPARADADLLAELGGSTGGANTEPTENDVDSETEETI